jgi:hypothetical protein
VITDAVPQPAGNSNALLRMHACEDMTWRRDAARPDPLLLRDASAILQNADEDGADADASHY